MDDKCKEVRGQADALKVTACIVMNSKHASTLPDVRITAHACRILAAARLQVPANALLGELEIEATGWATILATMNAVLGALEENHR